MASRLDQVTSVTVLVACVALTTLVVMRLIEARPSAPAGSATAIADVASKNILININARGTEGSETAQIALVEFADFQCPFCGIYARDTYPRVMDEFVSTGKLRHVFKHFPLQSHTLAGNAAIASECVGQMRKDLFWAMYRSLFSLPSRLGDTDLLVHAEAAGIGRSELRHCLESSDARGAVEADVSDGLAAGVVATPTFFIGRLEGSMLRARVQISGAQPYDVFKAAIEKVTDGTEWR